MWSHSDSSVKRDFKVEASRVVVELSWVELSWVGLGCGGGGEKVIRYLRSGVHHRL